MMILDQGSSDQVTIRFDFIELIGLYKLSMGFGQDDEDVEMITARLQVQLSTIVGP